MILNKMKKLILFILLSVGLYTNAQNVEITSEKLKLSQQICPDILDGGCAVFAYYLWEKINNPNYVLVNMDSGRHYLIFNKLDSTFIDPDGIKDLQTLFLDWKFRTINRVSPYDLKESIQTSNGKGPGYACKNEIIKFIDQF